MDRLITIKGPTGTQRIRHDFDNPNPEEKVAIILRRQRDMLITCLLKDVSLYVRYKFGVIPPDVPKIREALHALKNSSIDRDHYGSILRASHQHDFIHLGTALFYEEIDRSIEQYVK